MSELQKHLARRRLITEGSVLERPYRPPTAASPTSPQQAPATWQTSVPSLAFGVTLRKSVDAASTPKLQPMVASQVDSVIKETSMRLERMSVEISSLRGRNASMSKELEELRREKGGMQVMAATLETLRFQIAEMERDRRECAQVHEVLMDENKQLLKELQRSRQDLVSFEERHADEVGLLRNELKDEREQHELRVSHIQRIETEHTGLEAQYARLEARHTGLEVELSLCREEMADARSMLQASMAREAEAMSDLAIAKAAVAAAAVQAEAVAASKAWPGERPPGAGSDWQEEEQPEPECETVSSVATPRDTFEGQKEGPLSPTKSSESRLRKLLSSPSTGTDDLEEAILSVEALVGEARRELATKQLRERRAAFEKLHAALEGSDEDALELAIQDACRAQVDDEDVQKAQVKLGELRARSVEERAAKEARDQRARWKETAFLSVKRDDAEGLKGLIGGLPEDENWAAWRDHAGRSLVSFAAGVGSASAKGILESLIAPPPQHSASARGLIHGLEGGAGGDGAPSPAWSRPTTGEAVLGGDRGDGDASTTDGAPCTPRRVSEPATAMTPVPPTPVRAVTPVTPARPSMGDVGVQKQTAFRAVVKDDVETLTPVLEALPPEVWGAWRNRAGKDLLELSQERGSSNAYSALAKALGMVTELPRDTFEERETVWVYLPGDTQPRRATVMEDTPKEADTVFVEYWDGDEPASYLDRCMLRKMAT